MTEYNVYRAADGCALEFFGRVRSLRAARHMAAVGGSLPQCLWDTARAAGHCGGIRAPEGTESPEPAAWFGLRGECCAVKVLD